MPQFQKLKSCTLCLKIGQADHRIKSCVLIEAAKEAEQDSLC